MSERKTDVVIIGAGPTGLSLAVQLVRYNIDFIVLEKQETTTPYSKAVVVQARSMEIFDELELAERAINSGRMTTALNFFNKNKRRARLNLAGLGAGISKFPFALSLEQSKTEKLLVDHLQKHGKQIDWKCEFLRHEQSDDGVVVHYSDAHGSEHSINAAYVVGCDGAGSTLRHALGLEFTGDTIPKLFYIADATLHSDVINKDELFIFLIRKGFVLFFPMEGAGHYRMIGILPDAKPNAPLPGFEDIKTHIAEQKLPVTFDELRWFSTYKVHSRKATQFMDGRCFLAGDAAHIHTPAGGQGMNTGIQDAYNLAWKLAFTLRYQSKPLLLESYNHERMMNARNLLRSTDRMFDLFAGTNPVWNFLRLNVLPYLLGYAVQYRGLNRLIFPLVSQTGITYSHSVLTIPGKVGKVEAGNRMPYFMFLDGSSSHDHIKSPGIKLLTFSKNMVSIAHLLQHVRIPIPEHIFDEIPEGVFGTADDFHILLRPDNHVSYIGKDVVALRSAISVME